MKEQFTQKNIVLAVLALLVFLQYYFGILISPLRQERQTLMAKTEKVEKENRGTTETLENLRKVVAEEERRSKEEALAQRLLATLPSRPMIECHSILSEIAEGALSGRANPKIHYMFPLDRLPNRSLYGWSLSVSSTKSANFGKLLANIEQRMPLSQVTEMNISPGEATGQIEAKIEVCIAVNR